MKSNRIFYFLLILATASIFAFIFFFNYFSSEINSEKVLKEKKENVTVLMWTNVFESQVNGIDQSCPFYNRCTYTNDRKRLADADAVVYHFANMKENDLPKVFNYRKINIFLTQESYPNTVEYTLIELPKNFFHWVVSFFSSSHVIHKYGSYWINPELAKRLNFSPIILPSNKETILINKNRTIFWTVSNCNTSSKREVAVDALKKFINIDIFGKCGKSSAVNLCPRKNNDINCDFFNTYYFVFIGENSICKDYITEKYWYRYNLPVVPIVLKRYIYKKHLPKDSFIALDDFDGPKQLANYLQHLINNPDEYMKYFQWRSKGWAFAPWNSAGYREGYCGICEKLLSLNGEKVDVIHDVFKWIEKKSNCEDGSFFVNWAKKS